MTISGAERAVIDVAKVRDYVLSPDHRVGSAKAKFFAQLGFEQQDWAIPRDEMKRFVMAEARLGEATRCGQKYVVAGPRHGPSGRSAPVIVVWIILNGEDVPRFVTAYPGAKL